MIERQVITRPPKRQVEDLIEKRKKVGELLGVEKVPLHCLAWQEPRLELDSGDCYPVIDVLEKIAELLLGVKPGIEYCEQKELPPNIQYCETKEIPDSAVSCLCGFEAKNKAGLMSHQRRCDSFKAYKDGV